MLKISVTAKKMLYILLALGLIFFGITYAFGYKELSYGIIFGVTISSFRIFLLNYNINKMLYMGTKQAKGYMSFNYAFRMFLVAFAFYIAVKSDVISIVGTFVGIILMQPSAYFVQYFINDDDIPLDKDKIVIVEDEESSVEELQNDLKRRGRISDMLKEMFKS